MIFRQFAKKVYFDTCMFAGKRRQLMAQIEKENYVPVLNFHRVSPYDNPFYPPMHPEVFRDALKILQKHFEFVGLNEIKDLDHRTDSKPKIVVSFDDGYADFVEYALPTMDELGIRANQNIIPACVESGLPPWNVQMYDFFHQAPIGLINEMHIPGFDGRLEADTPDEKARFGIRITNFFNQLSRLEREKLFTIVISTMEKLDTLEFTPMMSAEDCREVSKNHDIGVHSFSHEAMALESDRFFQDDFEENGLREVDIYAFPYGSHTAEQVDFLLSKDLQYILLVEEKYAHQFNHIVPRFTMYGTSGNEVVCRAMGLKSKGAL